jgi:TnpA family transposase
MRCGNYTALQRRRVWANGVVAQATHLQKSTARASTSMQASRLRYKSKGVF